MNGNRCIGVSVYRCASGVSVWKRLADPNPKRYATHSNPEEYASCSPLSSQGMIKSANPSDWHSTACCPHGFWDWHIEVLFQLHWMVKLTVKSVNNKFPGFWGWLLAIRGGIVWDGRNGMSSCDRWAPRAPRQSRLHRRAPLPGYGWKSGPPNGRLNQENILFKILGLWEMTHHPKRILFFYM